MSQPEYQLTFQPKPGHPWTAHQRLKKLLKIAGHVLGLQCISAREVKPTANDQAPNQPKAAEGVSDAT